jgi:hypothetical protein
MLPPPEPAPSRVKQSFEQREWVVRIAGEVLVDRRERRTRRTDDLLDAVPKLVKEIIHEQGGAAVRRVVAVVIGCIVHEVLARAVESEVRDRVIGIYPNAKEAVHREELTAQEPRKTLALAALVAALEPALILRHHEYFRDFGDEQVAKVGRIVAVPAVTVRPPPNHPDIRSLRALVIASSWQHSWFAATIHIAANKLHARSAYAARKIPPWANDVVTVRELLGGYDDSP